jgi:hypothetical protein
MTVDFAITGSLVRPGRLSYSMLVQKAAALLHASFRHHLAMTPLRYVVLAVIRPDRGPPTPSCGHPRHTRQKPRAVPGARQLQGGNVAAYQGLRWKLTPATAD